MNQSKKETQTKSLSFIKEKYTTPEKNKENQNSQNKPISKTLKIRSAIKKFLQKSTVKENKKTKNFNQRPQIKMKENGKQFRCYELYHDYELGFKKQHQMLIHQNSKDDDIETDEEYLDQAFNRCMYDIKKAIMLEFPDEIKKSQFSKAPSFSSGDSDSSKSDSDSQLIYNQNSLNF